MTHLLYALALSGLTIVQQTDYTIGQQGPFCGVVSAYKAIGRGSCVVHLTIVPGEAARPLDVVISDELRRQMSMSAADYVGANVCVSGTVSTDRPEPYITITSASQIDVKSKPQVPFGAGALNTCEAGVVAPRVLTDVKPQYTADAIRARLEGVVVMDVVVGIDGKVANARVTRTLDPGLDEEALRAVKQWRFEPGKVEGKPVNVLVTIEMTFHLRRD